MGAALRPYIGEGDYVKAEGHYGNRTIHEEGLVIRDDEGTLRVSNPDGLNVNAKQVNIISWRENA